MTIMNNKYELVILKHWNIPEYGKHLITNT